MRVAQWHAQGWATEEDLTAAWDAAQAVTLAPARIAAQSVTLAAAWDAAWDAARAAAWDAEREAQRLLLLSMSGYGGEA